MKRIFKSPQAPEGLRKFAEENPYETWERFRRANRRGYREVKKQLLKDQHGLCAYCEINITFADEEGEVDDFRVEKARLTTSAWNIFIPKAKRILPCITTTLTGRICWGFAMAAASRMLKMRRNVFQSAK